MSDYVNQELKKDSSTTQPPPDVLSLALKDIIGSDGTISIDDSEEHIDGGPNTSTDVKDSRDDTTEVMRTELIAAKATIARQDAELSKLRAKCLQLEDHASTGNAFLLLNKILIMFHVDRGQLTDELSQVLKAAMASGFRDLELNLPDKIVKEMRADLTR